MAASYPRFFDELASGLFLFAPFIVACHHTCTLTLNNNRLRRIRSNLLDPVGLSSIKRSGSIIRTVRSRFSGTTWVANCPHDCTYLRMPMMTFRCITSCTVSSHTVSSSTCSRTPLQPSLGASTKSQFFLCTIYSQRARPPHLAPEGISQRRSSCIHGKKVQHVMTPSGRDVIARVTSMLHLDGQCYG